MNTNNLKRFAQQARRKLLEQVAAKLEQVLHTDSAELREKAGALRKLQEEINHTSKEQVIDKVAYTWFNRLMALRFMDANDYQPLGIRVITPKDGYTLPEILDEAKQGQIPDELPVKPQHIYDLLDGKIPSTNAQNEAYKELLVGACNHLNKVFPFLFERINDYAELLLPDDLTSEFSIVQDIREGMTTGDCQQVEIIGWLYQFYISEKKDEVFASKSKVKKEDIPAATQLFTPRWIVEYMVQNTLGKLWLQNKPNSNLREYMPYFIESPSVNAQDYLKVDSVEEITLLDQACGSGHILVYAFELFTKIYEEEGYNSSEIPQLIIEKNLYGFEIDGRAAQLAGIALMMKARSYQHRLFKKQIEPSIVCYQDLQLTDSEIKETFSQIGVTLSDELLHDLCNMQQSTNFGSLITPLTSQDELERVFKGFIKKANITDVFLDNRLSQIKQALGQLIKLGNKYHCIVDNPPYMGGGNMNKSLSEWVKIHYPKSKADLMVCFMNRAQSQAMENGFVGMINLPSWMFLSSFEDYRKELIGAYGIDTLLHLGRGIFGSDFGTVAFTFINSKGYSLHGVYRRLFRKHVQVRSVEKIRSLFLDKEYGYYTAKQKDFEKISGSPIGYWVSDSIIEIFFKNKSIGTVGRARKGMATANNTRFLRNWTEISFGKMGLGLSREGAKISKRKWFPYNDGGSYRKWYGNNESVVLWENDGEAIQQIKTDTGRIRATNMNLDYIFKEGLTWSGISSSYFSVRWFPVGFSFSSAGFCYFTDSKKIFGILALLNSKFCREILSILSPTINFNAGDIEKVPFIFEEDLEIEVPMNICKREWDSREISWDFQQNELLRIAICQVDQKTNRDILRAYDLYQKYWKTKFYQLQSFEVSLNDQIITTHCLQEDLTSDVPLEDITILKDESKIRNKELVFNAKEVFAQFVSYSVGCMFGRYSLEKEGLVLASQGETLEDFLQKTGVSIETGEIFLPDEDNIIPILDDEWFEDDITGRFFEFLKITFGKENFEKNLAFVEDALGKDIRKYFVKDFYTDHIKRYKKRPIYWMFSSPRGSFNVLIYLHRYTPNTLNQILNGYLKEYREKLNSHIEQLDHLVETGSSSEQTKAAKEKDKLRLVLLELQEYERDTLYPLASERISIDLDDGVLVNYNKFGNAIKPVAGLNDAKTKKKVKSFNWIDTSTII
jgi:hypothetical protein